MFSVKHFFFISLFDKECDDEDECGSGDELFSDDGSGDKKVNIGLLTTVL